MTSEAKKEKDILEITKGENANLAGMDPRCPKCDGAITWEKDDKFAVCNRAHKTDKGIIFHQFEIKSLADLAQFFRSPAPTPPLDVEAAAQEINEDEITRIRTGRSRLTEKGIADILRRHIASPAPQDDSAILQVVDQRDHWEQVIGDLAVLAGCKEEWSNLHEHGDCIAEEIHRLRASPAQPEKR